jgi:hypothetical protein
MGNHNSKIAGNGRGWGAAREGNGLKTLATVLTKGGGSKNFYRNS